MPATTERCVDRPDDTNEGIAAGPSLVEVLLAVLAWAVAAVLGFALTAVPAYALGFITKGDILNVFVGIGVGRYERLAVLTAIWALATAVIVTLLLRPRPQLVAVGAAARQGGRE